jgi:hypothetical protein
VGKVVEAKSLSVLYMTVLVSIKINDGVVMAADSASSFASGMVYRHADKIVNLRQGLPIGVMVTGAGGIGNESIDTGLLAGQQRASSCRGAGKWKRPQISGAFRRSDGCVRRAD